MMMNKNTFKIVVVGLLLAFSAAIAYAISTFAQEVAPAAGQATEPLFSAQHFTMVLTVLIPFLIFWMDSRRQTNKHHLEIMEQQQQLHIQNMERFKELEVKIQPLWSWWCKNQGRRDHD